MSPDAERCLKHGFEGRNRGKTYVDCNSGGFYGLNGVSWVAHTDYVSDVVLVEHLVKAKVGVRGH